MLSRLRRLWQRRLKPVEIPHDFNKLALRAGGKVVAERLIAGELRHGAIDRRAAITRALDKLEADRRSWR